LLGSRLVLPTPGNRMYRVTKFLVISLSSALSVLFVLGTVMARQTSPEDVYRHFAVYTEVLTRIKSEYVEEPDMEGVTLGALHGLLESIDPFASYLNEEQYQKYLDEQKVERAGVGLVLSRKIGYVSVVDSIPGSPADKAGLTTGDLIETIDGVATRDMPLAYAEMLLRGEPGSEVKLSVLRVRLSTDPVEVHLVRAPIQYPPVTSQIVNGDIGYVKVRSLETGKAAEVARHLKKLKAAGAKKILLDLRRAAAGNPEEGLALADLFLDEGLMAYVQGQKVPKKEYRARRETTVSRDPLVVVINRGTANGAEVAAAALLANKRCEVVGEPSYGDAAIRRAVPLRDGGAVILSVAKYHAPNGDAIQDKRVKPSVVSIAQERFPEQPEGEQPRIERAPDLPVHEDPMLQKAIEVLTKGVSGQVASRGSSAERRRDGNWLGPLGIPRPPL